MFKKILLASDGSDSSLRAAKIAIDMLKENPGAKVDLIYVVPPIPSQLHSYYHPPVELDLPNVIKKIGEEALKSSIQLFERENLAVQILVETGDPAEKICKVAFQKQYDLIMVGRRGLGPIRELALGSVSNKICNRAHCPVLVIN